MKVHFFISLFLGMLLISLPLQAGSADLEKVLGHAQWQISKTTSYDPSYLKLEYPGGDVPLDRGVCTDVIIRAFRATGVDLQVLVHDDMKKHFSKYPNSWGLKGADKNIDHRRVPNLMTFFKRLGKSIPISSNPSDYQAGDIVAWRLDNGLLHIGILIEEKAPGVKRNLVIHNIGAGAQKEDILFRYPIIGHYRYF